MKQENNLLDVVVIGGGVSGLCQIKHLIDNGFNAVVLEANDDLGGTWYRNRYPGCRFDSESYTYGYSFSQELLDEWHWKEGFSARSETLKYLSFVADKFELRQYCEFGARVEVMRWSEDDNTWTVTLKDGRQFVSRFIITCMGILSEPVIPSFAGIEDFQGESFHTYYWPEEPVELEGRKVGVVGTGATGVQIIQTIADKVGDLTVFQRGANWAVPLGNYEISDEMMADIRSRYDEIFADCAKTSGGFMHQPEKRRYADVSPEDRTALWDELYDKPGFAFMVSNFGEIFVNDEANKAVSDYVANRIRQRVNDPKTADTLIPKDFGFGLKRVPLETKYYEAYNRSNVNLIDLNETAIEKITPSGIQLSDRHVDLDVIIYATGFDAFLGAYKNIEVVGAGQKRLSDKWEHETKTYLGIMANGFPNMFMVAGPQSASGATNYPRAIEPCVDWITNLLLYTRDNNATRVEAQGNSEQAWADNVASLQEQLLFNKVKSWFTGHNPNLPNRQLRYNSYWGGAAAYRETIERATDFDYKGIDIK